MPYLSPAACTARLVRELMGLGEQIQIALVDSLSHTSIVSHLLNCILYARASDVHREAVLTLKVVGVFINRFCVSLIMSLCVTDAASTRRHLLC